MEIGFFSCRKVDRKVIWQNMYKPFVSEGPLGEVRLDRLGLCGTLQNKLRGLGPRINYTDRGTIACRRS
jgi:hypothetical protein